MRTCVRVGDPPYRPIKELERAIARGELDFAIGYARELGQTRGRPLDLALAVGLLALIAAQRPRAYDAWALRWLGRWIAEARRPTIARAAELAGALADMGVQHPGAREAVEQALRS
jgi:hypothetical protein